MLTHSPRQCKTTSMPVISVCPSFYMLTILNAVTLDMTVTYHVSAHWASPFNGRKTARMSENEFSNAFPDPNLRRLSMSELHAGIRDDQHDLDVSNRLQQQLKQCQTWDELVQAFEAAIPHIRNAKDRALTGMLLDAVRQRRDEEAE